MPKDLPIEDFIRDIPKAELHLHIEGTFEPEQMFKRAQRNGLEMKYKTVEEVKDAYAFENLQDFLNIYYEGAAVLTTEQDFYDLMWAYLVKVHTQGVKHAEVFFDPQTHTKRGIKFKTVIEGFLQAIHNAEAPFGVSVKLIMCFLRDMDADAAMATLEEALPYKDKITAVGLDSAEVGNPPSKFAAVFDRAREEGFLTTAHAGEEGPAEYVLEALDILKVSRVDHGNHCLDDDELVARLVEEKMPLTVCPLSNVKLKVVDNLKSHPLKQMMEKGLLVTINSDDPAYFGGYIYQNYLEIVQALELTKDDIAQLARNSFLGSFLSDSEKATMIASVDEFVEENK